MNIPGKPLDFIKHSPSIKRLSKSAVEPGSGF